LNVCVIYRIDPPYAGSANMERAARSIWSKKTVTDIRQADEGLMSVSCSAAGMYVEATRSTTTVNQ